MSGSPLKRDLTDLKQSVMFHPSKSPFQPNLWTRIHLDIKPQKNLVNLLKRKIKLQIINLDLVEDVSTVDLDAVAEVLLLEVRRPLKEKTIEEEEAGEEEEETSIMPLPQTKLKEMFNLPHWTDLSQLKTNKDNSRETSVSTTILRVLAFIVDVVEEEVIEDGVDTVVTTEEEEVVVDAVLVVVEEEDIRIKI